MKKIISILMTVVMALSFATVAAAAQTQEEIDANIATRAELDTIVSDSVTGYYDKVAEVISGTSQEIAEKIVRDPEFIKKYVAPFVAETIISNFEAAGVEDEELDAFIREAVLSMADQADASELLNEFMTIEFVSAVQKRAVKYTIDAAGEVGLIADKDTLVSEISDRIWNAPAVEITAEQPRLKSYQRASSLKFGLLTGGNSSYYSANVETEGRFVKKIKSIEVTGWNKPVIEAECKIKAGKLKFANISSYNQMNKLAAESFMKALEDEITERVTAFIDKAKSEIAMKAAEKISEMRDEAITEIETKLYEEFEIKVEFPEGASKEEIYNILMEAFNCECQKEAA